MEKYLIISVSGIGSTLLTVPMMRYLKKHRPDAQVDILVGHRPSVELLQSCEYIDNIHYINQNIGKEFLRNVHTLTHIFRKYDYSLIAFPANRTEFNLLAYAIHARHCIGHDYVNHKRGALTGLVDIRVPQEMDHDIINNLNMLRPLGINTDNADLSMEIRLPEKYVRYGTVFREKHKMPLIGLHPGGSADQPYKRWNPERFAELIARLARDGFLPLIFGGPAEISVIQHITADLEKNHQLTPGKDFYIIKNSILKVAGLIKACSVFISNDSGLMHVAVSMGTPVVSIYGASDPQRTCPYMDMGNVITSGIHCQPCNRALHNLGEPFRCVYVDYLRSHGQYKCLDMVDTDTVYQRTIFIKEQANTEK